MGDLYPRTIPDGTIVWTSPRGRTYPTQPLGAPARRRTRAEDRARRVQWERALNRARYDADPPPF